MLSDRVNILFVQDALGKFSETFVYRMCAGLENVNVHILTGAYENREAYPFDLEKITFWGNASLTQKIKGKINQKFGLAGSQSGIGFKIVDLINKSDADIVCFQFGFLPVDIGADMAGIHKKVCILHHGSDVNLACENLAYRKRLQNVWGIVEKAIFVSHFLAGVARTLDCPKEKQVVQYLGVPLPASLPKKSAVNEVFEFICVARLSPVKNHIRLVQAFSKVLDNVQSVELTLVGSGEIQKEIEEEVKRLGIGEQLHLTGSLTNDKVMPLVQQADCIVLVSQVFVEKGKARVEEGLPISLLEGASFGLPMIGSKTGGIVEIIEEGENGYLVDPLDIDDIAMKMIEMVNTPKLAQKMGKKSREIVEKKFDMNVQLRRFEDSFESMVIRDERV